MSTKPQNQPDSPVPKLTPEEESKAVRKLTLILVGFFAIVALVVFIGARW
jgi:hypothetical protein